MNKTFQKKGAVEMSLNLIIMLIIGMVVLGLVIGFVNSLVSQGVAGFEDQIGENEQLKLDEVRSSPENLAFLPEPSLDIKIGENSAVFVKVRAFDADIDCGAGLLADQSCQVGFTVLDETGTDATGALILSGPGFKAKSGTEDSKMYTMKTGTASIGTYYLTMSLYTGEDFEETKTLTVTVK